MIFEVTHDNSDSQGNMARKRPFGNEDSYEVSCKHPRPAEHADQLYLSGKIFPRSDAPQNPPSLDAKGEGEGEGEGNCSKCQGGRRIASESVSEVLNGAEKGYETPGRLSTPLWISGSVTHEDVKTEPAFHFSLFPDFFEFDHRVRAFVESEEIYSTLLEYPPQKLVSVGEDHQAHVPAWGLQAKNSLDSLCKSDLLIENSKYSGSVPREDIEREERLMGTCVIPMPDFEASASSCCKGEEKSNCNCLDGGSIRCTRQHVMEARDKLRENLGPEIFEELGFCDMGEEVAEKWTEEEEQAFHEAVLSNPASLGMNFWDHLSVIFPSRTKMDFVSYYFNVFMLRKRAEQNRFDPLNIDSDNDEWQRGEFGITEEEDDSGVESPIDEDAHVYGEEGHEENCLEEIEDEDEINACNENGVNCRHLTGKEDGGDIDDVSKVGFKNFLGDYGFYADAQQSGKIPGNNGDDTDIQDDSCTSYEYQYDRADPLGPGKLGTNAGDFS